MGSEMAAARKTQKTAARKQSFGHGGFFSAAALWTRWKIPLERQRRSKKTRAAPRHGAARRGGTGKTKNSGLGGINWGTGEDGVLCCAALDGAQTRLRRHKLILHVLKKEAPESSCSGASLCMLGCWHNFMNVQREKVAKNARLKDQRRKGTKTAASGAPMKAPTKTARGRLKFRLSRRSAN